MVRFGSSVFGSRCAETAWLKRVWLKRVPKLAQACLAQACLAQMPKMGSLLPKYTLLWQQCCSDEPNISAFTQDGALSDFVSGLSHAPTLQWKKDGAPGRAPRDRNSLPIRQIKSKRGIRSALVAIRSHNGTTLSATGPWLRVFGFGCWVHPHSPSLVKALQRRAYWERHQIQHETTGVPKLVPILMGCLVNHPDSKHEGRPQNNKTAHSCNGASQLYVPSDDFVSNFHAMSGPLPLQPPHMICLQRHTGTCKKPQPQYQKKLPSTTLDLAATKPTTLAVQQTLGPPHH